MTLTEVIEAPVLNRTEAFRRGNPSEVGHGSAQEIKWRVVWEAGVVDERHLYVVIDGGVALFEGFDVIAHLVLVLKREVADGGLGDVRIDIFFRSFFGLNNLPRCR